jgi:hypothetical protein
MIYFLIIANETISSNNINNNEQQNVIPWDIESLNGGIFINVQLILY